MLFISPVTAKSKLNARLAKFKMYMTWKSNIPVGQCCGTLAVWSHVKWSEFESRQIKQIKLLLNIDFLFSSNKIGKMFSRPCLDNLDGYPDDNGPIALKLECLSRALLVLEAC